MKEEYQSSGTQIFTTSFRGYFPETAKQMFILGVKSPSLNKTINADNPGYTTRS